MYMTFTALAFNADATIRLPKREKFQTYDDYCSCVSRGMGQIEFGVGEAHLSICGDIGSADFGDVGSCQFTPIKITFFLSGSWARKYSEP